MKKVKNKFHIKKNHLEKIQIIFENIRIKTKIEHNLKYIFKLSTDNNVIDIRR